MEIADVLTPFVSAPTFTAAVARLVILLLSAIMALVAWTAYTNPARSARSMSKTTSSNRPYMLLFAGRELGFAVALLAFLYLGDWRAVRVMLGCSMAVGVATDTWVIGTYSSGWSKSIAMHAFSVALLGFALAYLDG